jgi:hypothetical protein
MTAKLTRAEHMLWIVPILYGCMAYFSSYSEVIMMYYNNMFYLFGFFSATLIFLLCSSVPFYIHSILRKIDERNPIIAYAHIALTLVNVVGILFIFSVNLPIKIEWLNSGGELTTFTNWNYYNEMAISLFKLFIIIQLIYSIYGAKILLSHGIMKRKLAREDFSQKSYENELAMQMAG